MESRSDIDLDILRRALADQHVVLALNISDDRLVKRIARDAQARAVHDTAKADDGDVRRAAANVDDHRAVRLFNIEPRAQGRRQRLFDKL